jgi:hypothetical protein
MANRDSSKKMKKNIVICSIVLMSVNESKKNIGKKE